MVDRISVLAISAATVAALATAAPAGANPPLAHIAKAKLACSKLASVSQVSAAVGIAVKKPAVSSVEDAFNTSSAAVGSECDWDPVTPTAAYPSGSAAIQLTVDGGVSATQLHKLVSEESASASSPVYKGAVTPASGLGTNGEVAVLGPTTGSTATNTVVYALKGHDAFFVYSDEASTADVEALAADVYKKL